MAVQLGWLDTSIFVHPLFHTDPHRERCRAIIAALEESRAEGWVDVVVVHELTYVLPRTRLPGFLERDGVHEYVHSLLSVPGIRAVDKDGLLETVARWARTRVGFADARLAVLADRDDLPVCSVNIDDFSSVENTFVDASLEA